MFFRLCLILGVLSIPTAISHGDDWPDWMGPNRDGVWSESGIVKKFPEGGPKVVWRQKIGIGYTGPSVSDGKVYLMDFVREPRKTGEDDKSVDSEKKSAESKKKQDSKTDQSKKGPPPMRGIKGTERVVCLSAKTGKLIWEHAYPCTYAISYPNGPRCTPIVSGDKVYTLGAMGHFFCFNKNDGKIVWKKDFTGEYETKPPFWGYAAHPLIDGDVLFCTVGGTGSAVVAFDRNNGKEIWKSETTFDIGYVPLILFGKGETRQLIMWDGDGLSSLNPANGESNWEINLRDANPQPQATCIAMPRVFDNKLFLTDYYLGSLLVQLDRQPSRRKELWRTTKEQLREGRHLNSLMMTPFVKDGYAYGVGVEGPGNGHLMCVNLENGEKVWSDKTSLGGGKLTFANLFIVQNGDRYFLCNDQGELVIANLSPEGYKEIDRAKVIEPTHRARGRVVVWSHPAFAGGQMFARNDKEIICVELKESANRKKP